MADVNNILDNLYDIIQDRKKNPPKKSYVVHLMNGGIEKMVSKITEESAELAESVVEDDPRHVVYEAADLFFHILVLLGYKDIHPDLVLKELERRFGKSGITEKEERTKGK